MNKNEKIRFIYGISIAVLTIIVGLVFIIGIADLYYSAIEVDPNASPYTVENIQAHLTVPIVFLCIWIVAIIVCFVLSVIFPIKEAKAKNVNDKRTLSLLKMRIHRSEATKGHNEAIDQMGKYETIRLMTHGLTASVLLCCAVYILFYVFNPQNFHADGFKSDIMELVRTVLVWMILGFVLTVLTSVIESITIKAEINEAKVAIKTGDSNSEIASVKPTLPLVALKIILALAVITLMLIIIFAVSPSGLSALTGNLSDGEFMPPIFVLIGLAATVIVYLLVERLAKKANAPDKRTRLYCTIAAGIIAGMTVILYIIAPPLLTALMTKMNKSIVYFAVPALILIIAGFVLYRSVTKFVPQKAEHIILIATRASIAIVSISFIIAGITNGGANDVLLKAINICTECIGLG